MGIVLATRWPCSICHVGVEWPLDTAFTRRFDLLMLRVVFYFAPFPFLVLFPSPVSGVVHHHAKAPEHVESQRAAEVHQRRRHRQGDSSVSR